MAFLYHFLIRGFGALIALASLWSPRARRWREGRRGLSEAMRKRADGAPRVWFHCASLGEFEQGRPVMEKFREQFPGHKVLLTFFSPSGYEVRRNFTGADDVFYLPLDTPGKAGEFLDLWQPRLAVFIKYEYWFNFIDALCRRDIPILMVSAIFRPGQHFFSWYGTWFRRQLEKITWFYVQDERSMKLLQGIGIHKASLSGDTRFDRVYSICSNPRSFNELKGFVDEEGLMLVAGSTWPADEAILVQVFNNFGPELRMIIAPHEISPQGVEHLLQAFGSAAVLMSDLAGRHPGSAAGTVTGGTAGGSAPGTNEPATVLNRKRVLIVDGIGYLSHLYQFATLAYVGGGFGKGIHNILEAATFGSPVFFGPRYGKFAEAVELVQRGGAFPVRDAEEMLQGLQKLAADNRLLKQASDTCRGYVEEKRGASEMIVQAIAGHMKASAG